MNDREFTMIRDARQLKGIDREVDQNNLPVY